VGVKPTVNPPPVVSAATERWARSANAICAQAGAKVQALPPFSASDVLPDLHALLQIGLREDAQLAALPRPAGAAGSTSQSLLALYRQGSQLIRQLTAEERLDTAAIDRLVATSKKLNASSDAIANRLGAHGCAKNLAPGG
jgi:hypothetical protein